MASDPRPVAPAVVFQAGPAVFRGYLPRPPLARAVELVWMTEGSPSAHAERVLPNGVVELILNLGPPQRVVRAGGRFTRFQHAWVAGIQRGPLDIAGESDTILVGIRFRPGGAAAVLGLPARELTDEVIEWDGRPGAWVRELRERLLEAGSDETRLQIVEAALAAREGRGPDRRVAVALEAMRDAPAGLGIGALAQALGVTRKHLVELFRRDVGVGPKTLQRILRFQAVLRGCLPGVRWTDLAHLHGYADQAHLNHDFRALAGLSPGAYLVSRTVDPNHVAR